MATALSNLLALLVLDNSSYMDGLENSQKAADTFGGNLATVGGAVVLGALTAAATAVIGIGSAAFDAAETLDEAYDKIAVATGAMGPELDILKDDFDAVFAAIPADAGAAADVIGILNARLGLTDDLLRDVAIPLLEVTRLLGGDAKANTELFTRVLGDWEIPVDQAAGTLDKLFVAAQDTGVPLDSLMDQIVLYGAPMRNFGFTFEQTGGLLAKFASEGVNTEIVMSGMRIAQGKFIESGVDMQTGLWDTVDAIKNATNKTEGLSIATEIFGAKAAGDMYDTIVSGKFDIDGLTESMLNADGAILKAAAATSDWGEKWKIFQNKMTLALGPLGEKLREAFGKALDEVLAIFERPDIQAAIERFTNFAEVAISAVVDYIPTLITGIETGIKNFIIFLQHNQGVFSTLGAVWNWILDALKYVWDNIPTIIAGIETGISNFITFLQNNQGVFRALGAVWSGTLDALKNVWNNIWPPIKKVLDAFNSAPPGLQKFITTLVGIVVVAILLPKVFGGAAQSTPPLFGGLFSLVGAFVKLLGVAALVVKALAFFGVSTGAIGAGIVGLNGVIGGLVSTLLPVIAVILLVIAAVAAQVALLYLAWTNNWGGIQTSTKSVFIWLISAFQDVVRVINAIWQNPLIQQIWQIVLRNVQLIFTAFKAAFSGDWFAFGESLRKIWDNVWKAVVLINLSAIPKLLDAGRMAIQQLINLFFSTNWAQIGLNISQGIANGILSGATAIYNAARSVAKAALDAAKGFLGIKSPSKLFEMQVGYQMAVGLAKGWEGGLAALFNPMLGNLALANAQPVAAGGIASGAGGSPQNSDMLVMEEIRRMLRDLPNEIARATTSAAAKMPRSR